MYILTERYPALPLPGGCVKLAGGVPVFVKEACKGAYLVKKEGGFYAERRPVDVSGDATLELYVAAGLPRRFIISKRGLVELDGLDLFHGFKKRGLWRELEPSFYAAVSAYAFRCSYCVATLEVGGWATAPTGGAVRAAKTSRGWRVDVVTPPGRSEEFKQAVFAVFKSSRILYFIKLGGPADVALDAYCPPTGGKTPVRIAPAPATLRSLASK